MIIYVTIYDQIIYLAIYDDHITVRQCNPHFSLPGRTLSPPGLPVTGISSNLDPAQPMIKSENSHRDAFILLQIWCIFI